MNLPRKILEERHCNKSQASPLGCDSLQATDLPLYSRELTDYLHIRESIHKLVTGMSLDLSRKSN